MSVSFKKKGLADRHGLNVLVLFSIHDLNYSLFTLFFTTYGKNRFGMYVFFPNHFDLRILRVVGPAAAAA